MTTAQPAPQPGQGQQPETLTKREFEIAALVALALTDNQIAFKLHLSVFTVRCHVDNILYKLSLVNRVAICRWWFLNYYYPPKAS
jgi:DNA-binding NarL/FixJ family response regulator